MMDTCPYTFVKTSRVYNTRVNSNVNCGLRVAMMCQGRFIDCDQCTALVHVLMMEEAMHVYGKGACGNSMLPAQFC